MTINNIEKKHMKKIWNNKVKTILIEISDKKNLYRKKEKKILNFLQKRNFALVEKSNIFTVSIFSNIKSGDYLFINNSKFFCFLVSIEQISYIFCSIKVLIINQCEKTL